MSVSVKCDPEKTAKRIHVGPVNKLPLKKLINVYLHPPNVQALVTIAGHLRLSTHGSLLREPPSSSAVTLRPPRSGTCFETVMGELTPQSTCLVVTTDLFLLVCGEIRSKSTAALSRAPAQVPAPRPMPHQLLSLCHPHLPALGSTASSLTFQEKMRITK